MISRNDAVEGAPRQKVHQLREERLAIAHTWALPPPIVGETPASQLNPSQQRMAKIHYLSIGPRQCRLSEPDSSDRRQKLARCCELLGIPEPPTPACEPPADYRDHYEAVVGSPLKECPACHRGHMIFLELLPKLENRRPLPGYVMTTHLAHGWRGDPRLPYRNRVMQSCDAWPRRGKMNLGIR